MLNYLLRVINRRSQFRYKVIAWYYSRIFGECGTGLIFHGNCNIKTPKNIRLGKNVGINDGAYLNGMGGITIGDNVSISANAIIVSTGLDPRSLAV